MRHLLFGLGLSLLAGTACAQTPPAALTPVTNASATATLVLANAGGHKLYDIYSSGLVGGTAGFLLVINATSAPADGSLTGCGSAPSAGCLMDCVPFIGGVAQIVSNGDPPAPYNTGIVAVVSSAMTCFTKTTGTLTAFINGRIN